MTHRRSLKATLADLWPPSALIQGILALMFGATVCYLAIVGREIPGILLAILGTIIGFYFRTTKATEE